MAYDLSIIDRYTLQYRCVGTTIIVDVVDTLANNIVESTTFINAVPGAPIPNEITSFGRGRITALMADVSLGGGSTNNTNPSNATNNTNPSNAKKIRAIATFNTSSQVYPIRVALRVANRSKLIVRNKSPVNIAQVATTTGDNANRTPPGSGFIDIPPLSEYIVWANSNQHWVRPKTDTQLINIQVEHEVSL